MKVHALTPLFRWMESRAAPAAELAVPSATPGSHAVEMICLAAGTFSLTAAVLVPLTADCAAWLRWPLMALLLFMVPQLCMFALSSFSFRLPPERRETTHNWVCLGALTVCAAWLSQGSGWTAATGQVWLLFAAVNALFLFLPAARRRPA